ncbi:uncharacterized protein EI90DRAFT_3157767 [Cantharellus anzutake]|uniref:uncharacterized protein n=1 Tax=Cantharellus anzutake TaxID=1750568 RepID=UPI00190661E0|nr:uncharacterized protein EI90DRAFT_3157767 [Cantharellus anzutake]KAF8322352.1 hypothetical protein EI90DRAFT_3157767 [Cantharellus anzutake]
MSDSGAQTSNTAINESDFILPGVESVDVQSNLSQNQQTLPSSPLQCCELLVRNLPATTPDSAESHLKKVVADLLSCHTDLIKVAVYRSSTHGKSVDYAYLRPDASVVNSVKQVHHMKKWIKPLEDLAFGTVWSPMFGVDNLRIISLVYNSDGVTPKDWEAQVLHTLGTVNIRAHYASVYGSSTAVLLHSQSDVAHLVDSSLTIGRKAYSVKSKTCVQPLWPYAGAIVGMARYTDDFTQQLASMVKTHYPAQFLGYTMEQGNNALVFYVKDWDTIHEITNNVSFFSEYLASSEAEISPPKLLYQLNGKGFFIPRSTAATINTLTVSHDASMAKVYDQLAQHRLQVETVTAGADRAITTLTEQMCQTNEVVSSMSSVVQAQSHAIAMLNRLMAGMVHTIGRQMQVLGLHEEITLLVLERDHAKTDAKKDAITNKIMVLHQQVQSASETNSVLFKSLSDLQIGTSMTIDCLSPQQAIQSSSIQVDDANMALESPGTPDDPGPSAKRHCKVPYLMHSLLFHASVIQLH